MEFLVSKERLVQWDQSEFPEKMEAPVSLDLSVQWDKSGPVVQVESSETLARKVQKVLTDQLDSLVTQATPVIRVQMAKMVPKAQQEPVAHQGLLDRWVIKVYLELLVWLDLLDKQVMTDRQGRMVKMVLPEKMANLVHKVLLAPPDLLALLVV